MKAFLPYVQYLENMVTISPQGLSDWNRRASLALDGEPAQKLATAIDLETRRRSGAFFTGADLAWKVLAMPKQKAHRTLLLDPACGAGDLLLAAARQLPVRRSLQSTLELWGTCLAGCDAHREFVRATKARLVLLALHKGASASESDALDLHSVFPLIRVSDGLRPNASYSKADWIVVNPPFGYMAAPKECSWASGVVTTAAIFFEACLQNSMSGTRITAILPDVLRSGTRYEKWRQLVAEQSFINKIQPYGLFDHGADIDVFILDVVKQPIAKRLQKNWWASPKVQRGKTVGDLFAVHVGSVVPHRHRQVGALAPYIHARAIPRWKCVNVIPEHRRFNGRLFTPPFVAIRRTSRPEDKHRATGTLITDPRPVAVENHLIVCCPRDGTIRSCRQLLRQLRSKQASNWLNSRIRCRHLTVASIEELPINEGV